MILIKTRPNKRYWEIFDWFKDCCTYPCDGELCDPKTGIMHIRIDPRDYFNLFYTDKIIKNGDAYINIAHPEKGVRIADRNIVLYQNIFNHNFRKVASLIPINPNK